MKQEIRHRFIGVDESRSQLLYVDQTDAARNWTLQLPNRYRDYQLIGANRILLSTGFGYREYDLATRQLVKEVKGYHDIQFARRRANGTTVMGGNENGVTLYELGPDDKVRRKVSGKFANVRLGRLTPQGTVLLGPGDGKLVEMGWDGQVVKEWPSADKDTHIYQALRTKDGHLLVATGGAASLLEMDPNGTVIKRFGGRGTPDAKALGYLFFTGFQVLKNGNIVVSNWTGHGANDSANGTQLIEFDASGKIVWKWHDAAMAGSLHGVLILDDLDPAVLNDDISSVLGPVK